MRLCSNLWGKGKKNGQSEIGEGRRRKEKEEGGAGEEEVMGKVGGWGK